MIEHSEEGGPVIHSWRDVFSTNWRIHSFMGWRPNIPGGVDGIMVAYFMVGVVVFTLLGYVPGIGSVLGAVWWPLPHIVLPGYVAMIATMATPDDRSAYRYLTSRLHLYMDSLQLPELTPRREHIPILHDETGAGHAQAGMVKGPVVVEFNRPVRLSGSHNTVIARAHDNGVTGSVALCPGTTLRIR